MAKDIVIRNIVYEDTPEVDIPVQGGGTAKFMDTSDATLASAAHLPLGDTAYANGVKYTGTATENDSTDLTVSGATVTAPAGFYGSSASKSVASGTATAPSTISGSSASVSTGSNTLTLSKTVSVTPQVTTAGYVSAGTAGNASVSLTASVTTKAAATITPGTSNQEISAGTYLTGKQTVLGDANLKASNIVEGVSIFNIAGSAAVPVISQDATTKIVSIS